MGHVGTVNPQLLYPVPLGGTITYVDKGPSRCAMRPCRPTPVRRRATSRKVGIGSHR